MLLNSRSEILRHFALAGQMLIMLGVLPAEARQNLTVFSDHSTLITLPRKPGTVVVGNPSIADVTLDGDRLFLHGRGYGNTNITILDDQGKPMADYEVFVPLQDANTASVFKSGARQSYNCAGDCQPVLTVGDNYKPYFENLADAIKTKTKISRDQLGGDEAAAPVIMPAPITQ